MPVSSTGSGTGAAANTGMGTGLADTGSNTTGAITVGTLILLGGIALTLVARHRLASRRG